MNFEYNCIFDQGAEGLAEGISKLQNLKILNLNLDKNEIGAAGVVKLGEGISKLLNLTSLTLYI